MRATRFSSDRKERRKPFALGMGGSGDCHHCARPVRQLYMLDDNVWRKAAGERPLHMGGPFLKIVLHIGCVEKRLGRRLTKRDFYFQDCATGVQR